MVGLTSRAHQNQTASQGPTRGHGAFGDQLVHTPRGHSGQATSLGHRTIQTRGARVERLLKTHMRALPQQAQELVSKLTTPEPITERDIAGKLKGQVTELKNTSIRKNQLQVKVDGVKANTPPSSQRRKSYKPSWPKVTRHFKSSPRTTRQPDSAYRTDSHGGGILCP